MSQGPPHSVVQGGQLDPAAIQDQTRLFIRVLESALAKRPVGMERGAPQTVEEAAALKHADQMGVLLLRKMPEFIQWEQNGMITSEQLRKLRDLARDYAPRIVQVVQTQRARAEAAQQQQQQRIQSQQPQSTQTSPATVTPTSAIPNHAVVAQRQAAAAAADVPQWTALPPAIIFAPPTNMPVTNSSASIMLPISEKPPSTFNLHIPLRGAAGQTVVPPPATELSPSNLQFDKLFPAPQELPENMNEDPYEKKDVKGFSWPPWHGAGAERPTLTMGLSDGFGGSSMSTAPFLAPTSVYGIPESRSSDPNVQLPDGEGGTALSLSLADEPRTMAQLVRALVPGLEVDPAAENFLLSAADEFVESVTQFASDMALHRGHDTLEARDLQLHLERNYNIRLPGFAADETRLALSHSLTGFAPAKGGKDGAGASGRGVRAARLAAIGR